jgi:hypothetical protein
MEETVRSGSARHAASRAASRDERLESVRNLFDREDESDSGRGDSAIRLPSRFCRIFLRFPATMCVGFQRNMRQTQFNSGCVSVMN